MSLVVSQQHLERFLQTLRIVAKEAVVLDEVRNRLRSVGPVKPAWVLALDTNVQAADMVESFAAKFGRMQDTIGDKLIPLFFKMTGERAGTVIDNLNRIERIGLLPDAMQWMEMRSLRNQLVHEYMEDATQFAQALNQALKVSEHLFLGYRNFCRYCAEVLQIDRCLLPK